MSRRFIGIEIGAARLRGVQLLRARGTWRVELAAEQPLPPGLPALRVAGADSDESGEALRDALRALVRDGGFRAGAPAAVSMPPGSVFFHSLDTDLDKLDDVRRVVAFETEGDFPFAPGEAVLDIGPARKAPDGRQRFLVGAVSRLALERVEWALREARIACVSLDAAPCAFLPMAARSAPQDGAPFVALNLSEGQALLAISADGKLAGVRSFAAPQGTPEAMVQEWVREMELSWRDVFGAQLPPEARCIVGGDEAAACPLREWLAKNAGMQVGALEAFAGLAPPEPLPAGGPYTVAAGLALEAAGELQGMNFPAADAARINAAQRTRQGLLIAAALIMALVAAWAVGQRMKLRVLRNRQAAIRAETDSIELKFFPHSLGGSLPQDLLKRVKEQLDQQQKQYAALGALSGSMPQPLDVLDIIARRIPQKIQIRQITDLEIKEPTASVRMVGITDSYPTVDAIKKALQDAPEFERVSCTGELDSADRTGTAIRFTATFYFRPRTR